jgi:sortase A
VARVIVGKKPVSHIGRWLTAIGLLLLAVYAGSLLYRASSSRLALQEFDKAQSLASHKDATAAANPPSIDLQTYEYDKVDFSLWSKNRVAAYNENLKNPSSPMAVLRFEKSNLRVPVFAGTDEVTLNRGAGWIEGTARPGVAGNIGIAAHRDSFFRGLKDAATGDKIELATVARAATYIVDQIEIVVPTDVRVLHPRSAPSLTLVTCYPFYIVGKAPQRFIVHAALSE